MVWQVQFPVDFAPDGDRTNLAISKHISEIARLYALLQSLRGNFFAQNAPASPEAGQFYITPGTFELKVWKGSAWGNPRALPLAHDLDVHNAGTMADLQALVTNATVLYMLVAPKAADNGKVLSIDSRGEIVLSAPTTNMHGAEKHNAGTLAQLRALVTDGWLAALAFAPAAEDAGKILTVGADGSVTLSAGTLAALLDRVSELETAVAAMPRLESVAALPASPDPDTWYFVREATS